jgi:sortase A
MTTHSSVARNWAAFAFVLGLAFALWAIVMAQAQTPPQDIPVSQPSANSLAIAPSTPSPTPEPPVILYPVQPAVNDKVGTITLPSLGLSWPIFEGTTETQLQKGVGHYSGSVLPGIKDNSILSGHRTTVFNRLGELAKGDVILVKTSAGTFTYVVRSFRIVDRSDQTVIMPAPTAVLTLTTCYPFNNIGRTTDAFIVTADLTNSSLSK